MKIKDVRWEIKEIPLRKPFKIALGTTKFYRGITLKICTSELCGLGEAAPSPKITGDSIGSSISALKKFREILMGENPLEVGKIMKEINQSMVFNSSAKAAVDFALYDIIGKYANLPVKNILGGEKDKIETSLTVSIGDINETLKSVENLLDAGARVLKVKIGLNPEGDITRIREIRKITDAKIRVDANQGYSLKQAMRVLRAIERYEIQFVEQPLPANGLEELKLLRMVTEIPIMADESVHSAEDALRLIGTVDAINIKLMKSGGIHEAIKLASIAKAAKMKIMVGCMIETKIGISAGTHFALGIGADYADLDGYWDLIEQPYEGVKFEKGYNKLSPKPGLGITI